jgi:hypothetical protein
MSGETATNCRLVESSIENDGGYFIIARRNLLIGLWAGAKLGLPTEAYADYALEVMLSDLARPGPDDLIEKIEGDFAAHGIPTSRTEIVEELRSKHCLATAQVGRLAGEVTSH